MEIQLLSTISHFDVIADWLCSQNLPAQLRASSLIVATGHVDPAARLLREVGPDLEKLQFRFSRKPVGGLDSGCSRFVAEKEALI